MIDARQFSARLYAAADATHELLREVQRHADYDARLGRIERQVSNLLYDLDRLATVAEQRMYAELLAEAELDG